MPERATVFQATQVGMEVTPGVVVPCTKRWLCTQVDPVPNVPTNMYRPAGSMVPTTATQQKEWVQANLSGVMCFNDLVYLLSSLLRTVPGGVPSTPAGATNTRRWTFKPSTFAPDAFQTYTIEKGSATAGAERFAFGLVNQLNMRWTRTESNFTGIMMGQSIQEQIANFSGGATDVPALPFDPKSVTIYAGSAQGVNQIQTVTITGGPTGGTFTPILDGIPSTIPVAQNAIASVFQASLNTIPAIGQNVTVGGGPGPATPYTVTFNNVLAQVSPSVLTFTNAFTGGASPAIASAITTPGSLTKLTRVESLEVAIPDRYAEGFTLNEADPSFSYVVNRGIEATCQLQLEHDSVGAGFMADLRTRQNKFMKVIAHGGLIEAGFSNWVQMFFPFFFTANTRGDNNDIYESTYTLGLKYDPTFAGWLQVDVDNILTAL